MGSKGGVPFSYTLCRIVVEGSEHRCGKSSGAETGTPALESLAEGPAYRLSTRGRHSRAGEVECRWY